MNREIKFRGLRDTESGDIEMVYGQVSMDNNHNCAYYETHPDRIHWRTASGGHASAPVRKGTVGQYIGLKDKNGVEIYEGDIIRTYINEMIVVKWDMVSCAFDPFWWDGARLGGDSIVLGNIHQHPELLNS